MELVLIMLPCHSVIYMDIRCTHVNKTWILMGRRGIYHPSQSYTRKNVNMPIPNTLDID
uniref:Uncharacterized protein n=1 Tax=Rhizophora mucronata TaxID=61149 RepID=A0A2P2NIL4_RHIMU